MPSMAAVTDSRCRSELGQGRVLGDCLREGKALCAQLLVSQMPDRGLPVLNRERIEANRRT